MITCIGLIPYDGKQQKGVVRVLGELAQGVLRALLLLCVRRRKRPLQGLGDTAKGYL